MRIINIVDRLDRVNFGIWNAAIATAAELKKQYGVESEVWFPGETKQAAVEELNGALPRALFDSGTLSLNRAVEEAALNPDGDIIVSHGCWQYPTRWGLALKQKGFRWMAVPHGMLEAWSLSQKRLRKWAYFHLVERRALLQADVVRAVGMPEFENLRRNFEKQLVWIANGVPPMERGEKHLDPDSPRVFLFMARLHHKKGLAPLLEAWDGLMAGERHNCLLKIAGPDDGELAFLESFLAASTASSTIQYLGPVYGQEKEELLRGSHFYVLPSHSEGFPTSVLEAMQHGLVPLISPGCNFPDVFERELGLQVMP